MDNATISEILLELAVLVGLTCVLSAMLSRLRIPIIISALFVALFLHYTPIGLRLQSEQLAPPLSLLGQLGMLFLLFYIGLNIDLPRLRQMRGNITLLTILNTSVPFVFGSAVMLAMGYDWLLAFVIGLTCMPTAEAVIVPILDDFGLLRTRVGQLIVGAGTLDDIVEILVIALVSVWIGGRAGGGGASALDLVLKICVGLIVFTLLVWVSFRWLVPLLGRLLPRHPRNLLMLSIAVLFAFGGLTEWADIGMVVGALAAGVVMQTLIADADETSTAAAATIQTLTYGFFGLMFFFWVGLSVDLTGMLRDPLLAILLWIAASAGKIVGVLLMVPMHKLKMREAWTIGVGLDARLTTEIVVSKILLDAGIIDVHLFTALVASAALSTVLVPLVFTVMVRAWGDVLVESG